MKLSFVIPAYNVEDFIDRCLQSILTQPFGDFEVIVVDDGSTDGTASRLADAAGRDPRVRVIRQANAGQGHARNVGLDHARGEYVWFVDADDWLVECAVVRIARILSQVAPDVLVVNFQSTYDDRAAIPSSLVPPHLAGELVVPRRDEGTFSTISCWRTPPWRLVARRQHLVEHGIRFASGVFYEDHPFAIHLMLTAKSAYIDAPVAYCYYQRSNSTTKVNDRKSLDFVKVRGECLALFRRYGEYDRFASIVAGYLFPANFLLAHVDLPFRRAFVDGLAATLTQDDYAFAERLGDLATRNFARAVRRNDRRLLGKGAARVLQSHGPRSIVRRLRGSVRQRFDARIWNPLRTKAIGWVRQFSPRDKGRNYLSAGIGARIESIHIDVRVKPESRPYVIVGDYSHIGGLFVFERGVGAITIGSKSSIGGGCKIICTQKDGITIGDKVMLSWNCTLIDTDAHSLDPEIRANDAYDWKCGADAARMGSYKDWSQVRSAPIVIEDSAWLGFGVAVMKGVRIGRGAVIGSGSVVTSDVPPYCVYAGSPARFVRLVPRDHWRWEDIVHATQGDPDMQSMLRDSYLHRDLGQSLLNFRASAEFRCTLEELRAHAPQARTLLDVGGAGGVMSVAFALEGYDVTLVEPSSDDIVGTAGATRLLNWAAEKIDSSVRDRMQIVCAPLEQFQSDRRFDIAYCRQVVHHFVDPVLALRCLYRLLSDDGLLFLVREHVIFDEIDRKSFLESHPFQRYTAGEAAYHSEEYRAFISAAGFALVKQYALADTPINSHPHTVEFCLAAGERGIPGRPYSFLARMTPAGT